MELPEGYNQSALCEILERAKADVEKEYGAVVITDYLREKLLGYAHYIAKNYNSQLAYEELKREIINFIKNGGRV
ncbi:MAG: hypothetical protein QME59_07115 [Candidatus Hydrothermarchaeota archaeon]|nr:hypothetical protein [Candidatus Hydrothermarchaeota archaeon]